MQSQNLTELMGDVFNRPLDKMEIVKPRMEALAAKNEKDLADKPLPDYLRIPTAEELIEMRQWAIDYRKANKQASKREVRKAVQSNFHIKIYR